MAENNIKSKSQTKIKLVIDIIIFFIFLIAMEPRSSGIAVHEWLTTSALAALVVHLLLSWDWIVNITRCFVGKVNSTSRINYILSWLLFFDGTVIMLSGFMISESLLPFLGIQLPRGFAWRLSADRGFRNQAHLDGFCCLVRFGCHSAVDVAHAANHF